MDYSNDNNKTDVNILTKHLEWLTDFSKQLKHYNHTRESSSSRMIVDNVRDELKKIQIIVDRL